MTRLYALLPCLVLVGCSMPQETGVPPEQRTSVAEELVMLQREMLETSEKQARLFDQRIEPGMTTDEVVQTVKQIITEVPWGESEPRGEPDSREFGVVDGVRVDTWLYRLDSTFSQSRPDLDFVLTFHDGALVAMRRRG